MAWNTILVPHDFSSCANHATALARDVAKAHGARIVLVHVADLPLGLDPDALIIPAGSTTPVRAREIAVGGAQQHLDDLAARLQKDGVEASTALRLGDAVDQILSTIAREGADLVVMGTHGRSGLARLVVGSVTEKVVRQSPVPVLTLRAE